LTLRVCLGIDLGSFALPGGRLISFIHTLSHKARKFPTIVFQEKHD
jgi:hypothetical protein